MKQVISMFEERYKSAIQRNDFNAASDWEFVINQVKPIGAALEAVVKDLETVSEMQVKKFDSDRWDPASKYHLGYAEGIDKAIDGLKEVLTQHAADNTRQAADTERNDQHSQKE